MQSCQSTRSAYTYTQAFIISDVMKFLAKSRIHTSVMTCPMMERLLWKHAKFKRVHKGSACYQTLLICSFFSLVVFIILNSIRRVVTVITSQANNMFSVSFRNLVSSLLNAEARNIGKQVHVLNVKTERTELYRRYRYSLTVSCYYWAVISQWGFLSFQAGFWNTVQFQVLTEERG